MIRNRIRIRINLQMTSQTLRNMGGPISALFQGFEPLFRSKDLDPHQGDKSDPDPGPHQGDPSNPDPYTDPQHPQH
jgi:hypothetical protein